MRTMLQCQAESELYAGPVLCAAALSSSRLRSIASLVGSSPTVPRCSISVGLSAGAVGVDMLMASRKETLA